MFGLKSQEVLGIVLLLLHYSSCQQSRNDEDTTPFIFTQSSYHSTIYENSAPKTYVVSQEKMGVYLKDPQWTVKYRIVSGDPTGLFKTEEQVVGDFCFLRIRIRSGNTALLNREVKDNYQLLIYASEKSLDYEARTKVVIQVLDINDLRPLFSTTSYKFTVAEDAPLKTVLGKISATDADQGQNAMFYYTFHTRSELFCIHPTSGIVMLIGHLNATRQTVYRLEILAVDRMRKISEGNGFGNLASLEISVKPALKKPPFISSVTTAMADSSERLLYATVIMDLVDPLCSIDSVEIIGGDPDGYFKVLRSYIGKNEFTVVSTAQINWLEYSQGFNLSLRAKDKGKPPVYSPLKTIFIPPWRYARARFEHDIYKVRISECAPPGSHIATVNMIPAVPLGGYHLKTYMDKFRIITKTGLVMTRKHMDVKDQSQFHLEISALDGQISTTVVVDLIDCNNHSPLFSQTKYEGSFNENLAIGTKILQISATDTDIGNNGNVTYKLVSPKNVPFIIDQVTGVITNNRVPDYELNQRLYNLKVWASDLGEPFRRQSEVYVSLMLNNLNDNAPVFEKINCNITIPRDLDVGEKVVDLSAVDADELQTLQYEIISGNELQKFRLDPISGDITVRGDLSSTPPSSYSLVVTASDGENKADPTTVHITVSNKGSPKSIHCEETGVINKITERMINSFKLQSEVQLDEEDTSFNVHPINIHFPQFNENFPVSIDLPEDIPVNSSIAHLSAIDLDTGFNGKLVYVISSGAEDGCFNVNMETGELIVTSPLDHETTSSYILNITVYDLGMPQKSSWKILAVNVLDVNDNEPKFPPSGYCVLLREDAKSGSMVLKVKADDIDKEDNGRVRYSLLTPTDKFTIDSITGDLTVKSALDRELLSKYKLKIEARDQPKKGRQLCSFTDVVITLEDVNDNAPYCRPVTAQVKIAEDVPTGVVIYFVDAQDSDTGPNGEVSYSLINNEQGTFRIEMSTGALILEKELDFETRSFYNLTIRASDAGSPFPHSSVCHVEVLVLDVNENLHPPLFKSFVFQGLVPEDSPVGTLVLSITAQDQDKGKDGEIRYAIKDGTDLSVFSIDEETGSIRTDAPLDRESMARYWLTVYATDLGSVPLSSVAEVYIEVADVNDNIPQLSKAVFYASVPENSPPNVSILSLEATDADLVSAGKLTFHFSSGSSQGLFMLNPNTGLISTSEKSLDRENKEEHILEVTVSDNGTPPLQSVSRLVIQVLDVNDNTPMFSQKLFTVLLPQRASSKEPSPVYRLIAMDRDKGVNGEVTYSVTEQEGEVFSIDPTTGVISSSAAFPAGDYSILTVKATDGGSPSRSSTVRLHIQWIHNPGPSDEPLAFDEPQFTFQVMETDPVNHMLGLISTEPMYSQCWFHITGGNEDLDFDIDKTTSGLVIARPLQASRRSLYNLTVQVTDGARAISTQVFISVIPGNYHRPEFTRDHYTVQIAEDAQLGSEVIKLSATDKDSGNRLIYTIQGSADPRSTKMFRLDPNTGVLFTTETMDYETMPVHILTVMVRDQEVNIKRNFVRVTVQIQDVNDHSPHFLHNVYDESVSDAASAGTEVLQVQATDKDRGLNAKIRYFIQSGNMDGYFTIDESSGMITVAKSLAQQSKSRITVTITAIDQGTPQLQDIATVNLQIKPSDTSPPTFTSRAYVVELSESVPVGSFVTMVSATSLSSVNYDIKEGNAEDSFYINCYSGIITTQKNLDFETTSSYQLKIRGNSSLGYYSESTVFIYIIDENDNAPVFSQEVYLGQISENAPIGSMVTTVDLTPLIVQANDNDTEANAILIYQILDPEMLRFFKISPNMGTLFSVAELDFETTPSFSFEVNVRDSGMPSLFASQPAKVTIQVTNVNDSPPKFLKSVYDLSMYLPAYNKMHLLTVTAEDLDSEVVYSISEGNADNTFLIDPKSGVLLVNDSSSLLQSHRELSVKAWDGLYYDTALIKINMTPVGKTNLKFDPSLYTAKVKENDPKVVVLNMVDVVGNQLNEPVYFSILTYGELFQIGHSSGVLQTRGLAFDREVQGKYDVIVEARDSRSPPRVSQTKVEVYVEDVNDNAPIFLNTPYYVAVEDGIEPGDVIFQVSAMDKDAGGNSALTYQLVEDYKYFRIDPSLGDIVLRQPFDYEALNQYVLKVIVRDSGEPSLKAEEEVVVIIRNKSNPIFQSLYYTVSVPENVPVSTPILHIQARSPEGFRIVYNIVENEALSLFSIDFKTGSLSISGQLDYETKSTHLLTIRATDSALGYFSEARVLVNVEDVNDHSPVFSQLVYTGHVMEKLPPHQPVIKLLASDQDSGKNQEVSYHLLGNDTDGTYDFFHINHKTGEITTAQEFDYEATRQFQFKVRATDNGLPPLHTDAVVIINVSDVNDNPPEFKQVQYEANVSELASCGHIVIKVQAFDLDSMDAGKLEYLILSGNNHRHFTINKTTGVISLSNLCRNSMDLFYQLQVSASDGIYRDTVPVYINVTHANKHTPTFQQDLYEVELAENAEIGTTVIELAAKDPDDGPYGTVTYSIMNKLALDMFSIDSNGNVTTLRKLDRENATERLIAIKVMAKDGGGRAAFCTVKIILTDENDNPPLFIANEYTLSVQSNLNRGMPIIQVVAYDADEGQNADVTYSIDKFDEDLLQINPYNGTIIAKKSLLGLENKDISFTVVAKDGAPPNWSSLVPVHLHIVPTEVPLPKFSEPLYSFSASEDLPAGSEVGLVKATAAEPIIYSLVEGTTPESNKDGVFSLDKHTGALIVKKGVDHEKIKWYLIDVQANCPHLGKELVSLVSVSIQVKDINDNQPVFEADLYRVSLTENMPAGTTVIQVTANDQDTGNDGIVTYSLKADTSEIHRFFTIDAENGWITTLKELDCEKQDVYRFHVVASDQGKKIRLSSETMVEVTVTDDNDNPPRFTSQTYRGSIAENSEPGQVITTLKTRDSDMSESNRKVTCFITDGDPFGQFSIGEVGDQWVISSKKPLDREETEKHVLKVTASDGKFQATTEVEITVLDINDNSPECQQILYTATVAEDAPPGLSILRIAAKDPDVGNNAQITYALYGLGDDRFRLDPYTGELTTLAPLDREQKESYHLIAKATDGGGLSCQSDVVLYLEDVNDNGPVFSLSHYAVTVYDNTTLKTPVAVVIARDPDEGINSEVLYSFSNSANGLFSVEEATGVARLEKPLEEVEDEVIELVVCATDRGIRPLSTCTPITVSVVSLSYYRSVFGNPENIIMVPEDQPAGSELLNLAELTEDIEGSLKIQYEILNGNENGIFHLTDAGTLFLKGKLDFENQHQYFLSIEGTRGSYPPLSDVTVVVINVTDINDHKPVFTQEEYQAEIPEDAVVGDLVAMVNAVDLDGPNNNKVTLRIVGGDPQGHFSIHPERGDLRVLSRLDREQKSRYSLVIRATDNGVPALSSEATVQIHLLDVNDNRPLFLQSNYSLVLQDGSPAGTSVLTLIATDKDSPKNGPPFHFQFLQGNEDNLFHLSHDGVMSTTAVLSRSSKEKHLLKIQVSDSGTPHLSSSTFVSIQVIDQSRHSPTVLPLEIFITTSEAAFRGSVLGKLHATDQDPHDTLMYSLPAEEIKKGLFSVGFTDGKVIALENLRQGHYSFNVTVSDGTFTSSAPIQIYVWCFSKEALQQALVLRFENLSPEDFIGDHWRNFQRYLGNLLSVDRQQIYMASLQKDEASSSLDLVLVAGTSSNSATDPQALAGKINAVKNDLDQTNGLRIEKIFHLPCRGPQCRSRMCQEMIELDPSVLSSYSTARLSVITPQHVLRQVCTCNGTALRFDGRSFLRYRQEVSGGWKVQFTLKSRQSRSVLLFVNGSASSALEFDDGYVKFKHQCQGVTTKVLSVKTSVNDGSAHSIMLDVAGTAVKLSVDRTESEETVAVCMGQFSHLVIGAYIQESDLVSQGFQGCLDDIRINGREVAALEKSIQQNRLSPCCAQDHACGQEPCSNQSMCSEMPNGAYACLCQSPFPGPSCVLPPNPCASSPCLPGKTCTAVSNGFTCSCPPGYRGDSCQDQVRSCKDGSCPETPDGCIPSSTCNCSDITQGQLCAEVDLPATDRRFLITGAQEIVEILGGVLAVLLLVGVFVIFRKRVCQRAPTHKQAPQEDPDLKNYISRDIGVGTQGTSMELNILSHGARNQLDAEGQPHRNPVPELLTFCKPQTRPAVCSVAPNLPAAPPSSSDNESIAKNNWDCEESVYTGDSSYWPSSSYNASEMQRYPPSKSSSSAPPIPPLPREPEREPLFGGFPFPLEAKNKRAPIPPCYGNRNLDDFLPPSSHCQDQYTAISYYPSQLMQPEGMAYPTDDGLRRLSVRLSVAQPSYADCRLPPMTNSNLQASDLAESDYGSCEEVMF
ncbi:protocadherin Fat 2 [Hyperolius riggenbachi]|uniref:protocadherin Fat 2 n=1 Tax=Hyperolius riggenbachi TaxID=752182 RepID=UPI0035A3C343